LVKAIEITILNNENYFPIIYVLFNNLIGLIPYNFTATSHLIVTFTLSFSVFIRINILTFEKYTMKEFSLFVPANSSLLKVIVL
jgi:F-type H+-transporting ATPase subunit a